jgi:hypothetical protein
MKTNVQYVKILSIYLRINREEDKTMDIIVYRAIQIY